MEERQQKKIVNCIYYFALTSYLCLLFINQTELLIKLPGTAQRVMQLARYGCYALFLTKIILVQVYKKRYVVAAGIGIICILLCVYNSGNRKLVFTTLVMVASYGCDWKKIIKVATCVFAIGLFVTILSTKVGILEDLVLDNDRGRHNLGFNWVTLGPIYYFFVCIGITNLHERKIHMLAFVVFFAGGYYLYKLTNTRLTFFLNILFLLGVSIQSSIERKRWRIIRRNKNWLYLLPLLLFICVIVIQGLYSPQELFWQRLDKLTSGRISLTDNNLKELPITLFGQDINWQGLSLGEGLLDRTDQFVYNNVDSSFVRIMLDFGVVGIFLTICIYSFGIKRAAENGNYALLWSYIVVLLFSLTEQWMIELSFNYMPLVAVAGIPKYNKRISIIGNLYFSHKKYGSNLEN